MKKIAMLIIASAYLWSCTTPAAEEKKEEVAAPVEEKKDE